MSPCDCIVDPLGELGTEHVTRSAFAKVVALIDPFADSTFPRRPAPLPQETLEI